jgi:hypothetical protein
VRSISFEKPQQVSRPFLWWSSAVALGVMIFFHGYGFALYALTAWLLYVINRAYRDEMACINAPLLEHRQKYRKWYEEQDAIRARYRAQKRRRPWI